MNAYPQSNDFKPGTWKRWDAGPRGKTAGFICPKCGQLFSLSDHDIKEGGRVLPSVVCPYAGCDFHEYIKLEGWQLEDQS